MREKYNVNINFFLKIFKQIGQKILIPETSALRGKFFFTPDRDTPTSLHPDPDPTRADPKKLAPDRSDPKTYRSDPDPTRLRVEYFHPGPEDPGKFSPRPE